MKCEPCNDLHTEECIKQVKGQTCDPDPVKIVVVHSSMPVLERLWKITGVDTSKF
jgi:hypothetical protein